MMGKKLREQVAKKFLNDGHDTLVAILKADSIVSIIEDCMTKAHLRLVEDDVSACNRTKTKQAPREHKLRIAGGI